MDLHCQYCGEQIVARSFGKCPKCYRDLPEELQLTSKEKEMEELEQKWRDEPGLGQGLGDGSGDISLF